MNLSVRQRICDAVKERFQTIRTANGYETELGARVFFWRVTDISEAEITAGPVCNLNDSLDEITERLANRHTHMLTFDCKVGVAASGSEGDRPAAFRQVLNDITRAIGSDRYWTASGTRLALDTQMISDETGLDQQARQIFVSVVKFKINYRTAAFDPFTLVTT